MKVGQKDDIQFSFVVRVSLAAISGTIFKLLRSSEYVCSPVEEDQLQDRDSGFIFESMHNGIQDKTVANYAPDLKFYLRSENDNPGETPYLGVFEDCQMFGTKVHAPIPGRMYNVSGTYYDFVCVPTPRMRRR